MTKRQTVTPPVEEIEGVIVGAWKGVPVYRCRLCPFDTLERQTFIDHFARAHPPLEVIEGYDEPEPNPDVTDQERSDG